MKLIDTIHHNTKKGEYKPLSQLTDEEFEEFLDANGFEIVLSEGGWSLDSRENTLKIMVNSIQEQVLSKSTISDENIRKEEPNKLMNQTTKE